MLNELDFKQLNNLTAFLKAESESNADFTISYLECLMNRYNLKSVLTEEFEHDGIPDVIFQILKEGKIPTKEDLLPLDSDTQHLLLREMIWCCGMGRIATYSYEEENEEGIPKSIDCILAMQDVSDAHLYGSYLFAGLALLMSVVPSYELVNSICNNFEDTPENIQHIVDRFIEVCISIFTRYQEDEWYYDFKDESDEEHF